MAPEPTPDKVAAAIAGVEAAEGTTAVIQQIPIQISSTGRHAVIGVPPDITDGEIAELAGWMLTGLLNAKRAERAAKNPASRLVVPAGSVVRN